jgi:DNA-binding NarL/FixJ family response regulator
MFSTFFVGDLPADITEPAIRNLLHHDVLVSVAFRDSPTGTVAMLEARTNTEAEGAAAELGTIRLGGAPLLVMMSETAKGQQLEHLFADSEQSEQRACGKRQAYTACVLLVDDDPMCLQAMQGLLMLHLPNVCVHFANSGEAAVKLNRTREFDAVLSDVQMPGMMDGLALVTELKRFRPHTPVVLMTGSLNLPLVLMSGAFGFIRKPADRKYCVAALQSAITYHALSKWVGKATERNEECTEARIGLLSLADAALAESQRQWGS